jgi:hypothetical protein
LQEPVNAAPLEQSARPARSAAIAICDITRPVPNHLFLRPLIETSNPAKTRSIFVEKIARRLEMNFFAGSSRSHLFLAMLIPG